MKSASASSLAAIAFLCAIVGASIMAASAASRGERTEPFMEHVQALRTVVVADEAAVSARKDIVATVEKGRMFGVIQQEGDRVQVQVSKGPDTRRGWISTGDVQFVAGDDVGIADAWLKVSKLVNPGMEIDPYRVRLNSLLDTLVTAARGAKSPREQARLIGQQLFEKEGFVYEENRLCVDAVLTEKAGNCWALSLLYLLAGRKLNQPMYLVVVPQHSFVRYSHGQKRFNVETTSERPVYPTNEGLIQDLPGYCRVPEQQGMYLNNLAPPRVVGILTVQAGLKLVETGRAGRACDLFARAVEINPRFAEAYAGWGLALAEKGNPEMACQKHARATQINPQFAVAYMNWGNALQAMGRYNRACAKYESAVEIDAQLAEAYSNWGMALQHMGNYHDACDKYAKATRVNPGYSNAYNNWGSALVEMGKAKEACQKFAKGLLQNP